MAVNNGNKQQCQGRPKCLEQTRAAGLGRVTGKEKRITVSKEQADCYLQAKDPKSAANDHFNDNLKPLISRGDFSENMRTTAEIKAAEWEYSAAE